ncbi:MAG: LysM peptidoglycan-binding domain-containing protein [Verrucomicrobia bacterium]|nr:LysM peptidoglycan-binding domain-containing protein [Verrucomicrobiota bacterium]
MKRLVIFSVLLAVISGGTRAALAQPNPAAAAAERAEAEERQRILSATVSDLAAAQAAQQKKIARLTEEIKSLREAAATPTVKHATAEDLNRLAERLAELDKRREADKELILAEIAKLAKTFSAPPVSRPRPPKPAPATNSPPPKVDGDLPVIEYSVQKGDTSLTAIVMAYNEAAKKEGRKTITTQQVLDANPGLNPNRMKIGQKINLPVPK